MKGHVIADGSVEQVLLEVAKETAANYPRDATPAQQAAFLCFFHTMVKLTTYIFKWLPPEEQSQVITTCATWFSIGMLFGKSPELLVKILKRVNPGITEEEIPDYIEAMLKRVADYGQ